jgi:NitT/TauT family transport system substrate-binding protein
MKRLYVILLILFFSATTLFSAGVREGVATEPATTAPTSHPIELKIAALKGPTAMGMVQMMKAAESGPMDGNSYNFTIAGAIDEVTTRLVKREVDFAAVPANLASVLYNNTKGEIKVLALNTLGVLYIVENGHTLSKVEDLRGKTIYASGKGATPEYALNYILSENGIDPRKDVTIEWKSEHTECVAALATIPNAIAMLPQPFVTTAMLRDPKLRIALDLTELWDILQKGSASPSTLITGVLVGRRSFIDEHPKAIDDFLKHYADSVAYVQSNPFEAAQLIENYNIVPFVVAQKALPYCNITFIDGQEMKTKLAGYLTVLSNQNPKSIGGALPPDDFYFSR